MATVFCLLVAKSASQGVHLQYSSASVDLDRVVSIAATRSQSCAVSRSIHSHRNASSPSLCSFRAPVCLHTGIHNDPVVTIIDIVVVQ
jgi:hypothetical protein